MDAWLFPELETFDGSGHGTDDATDALVNGLAHLRNLAASGGPNPIIIAERSTGPWQWLRDALRPNARQPEPYLEYSERPILPQPDVDLSEAEANASTLLVSGYHPDGRRATVEELNCASEVIMWRTLPPGALDE